MLKICPFLFYNDKLLHNEILQFKIDEKYWSDFQTNKCSFYQNFNILCFLFNKIWFNTQTNHQELLSYINLELFVEYIEILYQLHKRSNFLRWHQWPNPILELSFRQPKCASIYQYTILFKDRKTVLKCIHL